MEWYSKSAEQGDAYAQLMLSVISKDCSKNTLTFVEERSERRHLHSNVFFTLSLHLSIINILIINFFIIFLLIFFDLHFLINLIKYTVDLIRLGIYITLIPKWNFVIYF